MRFLTPFGMTAHIVYGMGGGGGGKAAPPPPPSLLETARHFERSEKTDDKILFRPLIRISNKNSFNIDMSIYKPNLYFVKIVCSKGNKVVKIFKL